MNLQQIKEVIDDIEAIIIKLAGIVLLVLFLYSHIMQEVYKLI